MDTVFCPIDAHFADEISALLQPPPSAQAQEYFDQLITTRGCTGLKVKQNGAHGKGVYADVDFREGDLVLKDQMLAGSQHSANKIDCLVCSFCFRFIGTIEVQIGRKLYLQDLGVAANNECDRQTLAHIPKKTCQINSSDSEDDSYVKDPTSTEECASTSSKYGTPLPKEIVESLMNGELVLPYSEQFPLPSVISCLGGCREAFYCSQLCAEADWDLFHSLLCTGARSKSSDKEALLKFLQHANETNDIFLLAAKVVSFTILKYRKLKASYPEDQGKCTADNCDLSLLSDAWKPVSMGYKIRWWECIALPDDVDGCDEAAFRMQIKELAFTSLQLLKAAIFDKECEPLFSLEIYGHIIGMFELNNLDLVVASPVEDYFLYIDDLPQSEKKEAERVTRPALDALGDDYSICCQGTAFFPLQSCMNHSCHPNARAFKREEDRDGQATIVALRSISKGEEVTISYIDEDLPCEERQAMLADYGFRCRCQKCLEEEP
ncbi:histone-lysine N-methyltransferase ATXR2 isoform X1 [Rhododendron vialii]|uniref:histone-lysine N-methyltransferase ATXR2 isoform X1 n=1 Tax=Rhododendron vialii TaxID=182163 RepID=UPI00265F2EAC|nr:histone-lysine N-methyltransferase ATXR2 isoform X1 [Rhododendron vialii]